MFMKTALVAVVVGCALSAAEAQVVPVGPFVGDRSEPFDLINNGGAQPSLDIFAGWGRLISEGPLGTVKIERSSSLDGNLVTPRTGSWMVSILFQDGATERATLQLFESNVHRFGGYFDNNSPTDDAVFEFFDASGNLLGTYTASIPFSGGGWGWHGWESAIPIATVKWRGLSPAPFSGGFIWFDDLELGYEPPTDAIGACCLDDETCQVMTSTDCQAMSGASFGGDLTNCADLDANGLPDACQPLVVTGACCLTNGDCQVLTPDECALVIDGAYMGDMTNCDDLNGNGQADLCEGCIGDLNGDGLVGIIDFLDVLESWGPCPRFLCPADTNNDNVVGVVDFLAVLANWGDCT